MKSDFEFQKSREGMHPGGYKTLQDKIRNLELQIQKVSLNDEDSERNKTLILKGFENCSEEEAMIWIKSELKKEKADNWIKDPYVKGEFKNMIWIQYESEQILVSPYKSNESNTA